MTKKMHIELPKERIEEFCKRHPHIPGFIRLAGMEIELTEILGRKVDMRTAQDLSRYFRDEVLNSSKVQYAEG